MPRRPGITFETVTPSPPETLPRMDVAAFVGFATRGPIDVPVPVEDVARFRDIFGPPLELVQDPETGRTKTAHLHRAVKAFFRNGGRRCWVVRVAQPAQEAAPSGPVERTSFGLPGLVQVETGEPSMVRARCYGATFDSLRVGTVLGRRLLPDPVVEQDPQNDSPSGGLALSWDASHQNTLAEDQLVQGDLLRLNFERLRVSVEMNGNTVSGAGTLFALDVTLKRAVSDPVTLRFDAFRLFNVAGNEIASTVDAGGDAVSIGPGDVQGGVGDSRQIPVDVAAPDEPISSYTFVLPTQILSLIEVNGLITGTDEDMETPATASIHEERRDGRLVAFAPVASPPTVVSTKPSDSTPGTMTGRTEQAHFFERAPDPLVGPGDRIEVGVEMKSVVDSVEGETSSSGHTLSVLRTSGVLDHPVFRFIITTEDDDGTAEEDESSDETLDPSDFEHQFVHVDRKGDRLKGWLQLGRTARRYETEAGDKVVEVNVRDALWQTEGNDTGKNESLPPIHSVERQRFDLLAWEGQELQTRLDHLGFATSHPRAWTDLPVDEDLFALQEGEAVTPEPDTLRADVFDPRFPLASPEAPGEGPFVPLGMADRAALNRTRGRTASAETRGSRLERERLATFSTDVFVDSTLAGTSTANLGEKADDMIYVDQNPASGMHSLWPIREATLLAVPDAVHRGWDEPRTVTPDSLPAPSPLKMTVDPDAEPPRVHLSWMVDRLDEEGVEVEVQEAQEPTFENPVVRYRGAETSVDRYVRSDDPVTLFFRYRVVADGQPEPWSSTRRATLPEPDFDPCADRPEVPDLALSGQNWLSWNLPESSNSSLTYEIQIDRTSTFDTPREPELTPTDCSDPPDLPAEELPSDPKDRCWYQVSTRPGTPAVQYVRIRARRETDPRTLVGGWSRTVAVVRTLKQGTPFVSKTEYDDPKPDTPGGGREGLLDVQRAMLRFGAARGDVLSVLSLPRYDQPDDARSHVARLRTPGAVLDYGEERTLSYGTVYYPWLLGSVNGGTRIAPAPPDGAACGMIADRTLRDGAWMAPANESLAEVWTVVPPLTSDERADLEASPINVFTETPDGVLTLGTATLARDPDLEPVTTRRLLILVRRLVRREGPALVFENNTPLLRRRIAEQLDDVLRRLFDQGAFAGATPSEGYRVVADESVNPPRQVQRGRLVVEIRIAPARPLKFLTVRLVQRSGQRPAVSEPGAGAAA